MISTAEINKMPIKDRIILMEEIWSTLRNDDNSEIDWPENILQYRRNKINNGKAALITIEELKIKG